MTLKPPASLLEPPENLLEVSWEHPGSSWEPPVSLLGSSREPPATSWDPRGVCCSLAEASWKILRLLLGTPTSLWPSPGSSLEPKNFRRMLRKSYFLQGKIRTLYFTWNWCMLLRWINMHHAKARARILQLSWEELRSHAPENPFFAKKNNDFTITSILHENGALPKCTRRWGQSTIFWLIMRGASEPFSKNHFFAMKNTDFVVARILHENDAIRKYARRWGQTTISRILLPRTATSCSQNHIFYQEKRWSCTCPKSRLLLASRWTPGRPEASAAEFLGFGPKAPRACSKNVIFH